MKKISGWITAALMAGALALPSVALAQHRPGGGGGGGHAAPAARPSGGFSGGGMMHTAPHMGGGGFRPQMSGRSFAPHVSGRSFSPHVGGRSFSRHVGAPSFNRQIGGRNVAPHFSGRSHTRTVHRGVTTHRSVERTSRSHRVTRSHTAVHTPRNAGVQHNNRQVTRHNAVTPQQAQQGRFASHYAGRNDHDRYSHLAARRAWRHHHRANFVAWYGPLFWPYAYSDIFDYTFWPYGYDDGYWDYAYDDFFDGIFWGKYGPSDTYAYAPSGGSQRASRAITPRASSAGVAELCTQPGTGITAWPFAEIERKVGLNADQKQLLGDVRKAAADAAATFKASCPANNAFPRTPPGRLQAMLARLQGTLDAVKLVRPPLEKFYASLSDEQKASFNMLGPKQVANNSEAKAALPQNAKTCDEAKPGLANLPIDKIADAVKPTDKQQDALKQLQDATGKAVAVLQKACPDETPITPPGRLEAMEQRLQAMVEAAKTVQPALDGFYTSLSDEQKARFDRIGRTLAQNGG